MNTNRLCLSGCQIAAGLEKNLLPRLSSSPPDIESLRLYLTLPECPLFSDQNNYVTITIPFAKSIVSLKDAALKVLGRLNQFPPYFMTHDVFNLLKLKVFINCFFSLGNWWSTFEPTPFQRLVELYKEVVVYLLRMHKLGIPSIEQRIFNCFLDTSLRFLKVLHAVRTRKEKKQKILFASHC